MNEYNLRQAFNGGTIKGQLNEIGLKEGFDRNNKEYIGGYIIIKVPNQKVKGESNAKDLEMRLGTFSHKYLKKDPTKINQNWAKLKDIIDNAQSVAAVGENNADWFEITPEVFENKFYSAQKKEWVNLAGPGLNLRFFRNLGQQKVEPEASFLFDGVVGPTVELLTPDEEPYNPPKFETKMIVPMYNQVDIIKVISREEPFRAHLEENQGQTIRLAGTINFSYEEVVRKTEMAVGDPVENAYTRTISELVVTGASLPLAEKDSYSAQDIQNAIAKRNADMATEAENREKQASTPAPKASSSGGDIDLTDLGF